MKLYSFLYLINVHVAMALEGPGDTLLAPSAKKKKLEGSSNQSGKSYVYKEYMISVFIHELRNTIVGIEVYLM